MTILDKIYNKIDGNIDKQVNLFNNNIVSVLKKIEALSIIRLKDINKSNILTYDLIWRDILQEAGYYDLVDSYVNQGYDSIYENLNDMFKDVGLDVALSSQDIASIDTLKEIDIQYFTKIGDDAGLIIKRNLTNYVMGGLSAREMAIRIREDLDNLNLSKYAYTYAQTSISKFNQAVINMKSKGLKDIVWIYSGVQDSKTRDFCNCILNKNNYYNDSDKIKLEYDSRRHWNCRHIFLGVSKEYALMSGFNSGVASC